ncbi:MAG TPA: tripartite tricarboxylate transporter substrate binding protein [Burkholderiales bacterium]|jgi:tripartite-type tricarboxylate transporter receptor subunit TctC
MRSPIAAAAANLFPAAVAAALLLTAGASLAQTWPTRPVTLVVPYPAGGSADILARLVGQKLAAKIGQAVVVDNRGGAGTAIGARFVAEAPADGYTLLMGTVSSQAINPAMAKVGYDPVKDFTPVAPVTSIPFVLVANPASPYHSVAEVVAAAKAKPGVVAYASAGPGTSNHLAGEMLANAAHIKLLHVPYRGSAPALADVLAGQVPLMFDLQATSLPHLRSNKLRALGMTSAKRSPLLPEVPTIAESGYPGFEVSAWFGIFAPAAVPAPVIAHLNGALEAVLRTPETEKSLRDLGTEPDTRGRAGYIAYVREESRKYSGVVKAAGLTP